MIKVGDKIGNIEVVEEISHDGWFANVYKAKDRSVDEDIALKVLKITSDEEEKRFRRENSILHTLKTHENIIMPLSAVLIHEGHSYYLLELANLNLEKYIRVNSNPNVCQLLDIFIQICSGLKHAHSKRIVHRDLHKGNILLKKAGDTQRVKLSDFGQGKNFALHLETITTSYIPLRAITITAPEVLAQVVNKDSVFEDEVLADIFSLGIIFHCIFNSLSPNYNGVIIELKEKAEKLGIYLKGTSDNKRKQFHDLIMQYFKVYELTQYFRVLISIDEKINEKINLLILGMTEPDHKKRMSNLDTIMEEVIKIKAELANA